MLNVIARAETHWPRATESELELLSRTFKDVPEDIALEILDEAKLESKYATMPLREINIKAKGVRQRIVSGSYIECWAVHKKTGKFKTAWMLASNNEGALFQMNKYLSVMGNVEPDEYTIIVDDINQFHNFRNRLIGLRKDRL